MTDYTKMTRDELAALVQKHNKLYWDGEPEISDVEYDQIARALEAADPSNDLVKKFAHEEVTGETVVHKRPMLSLQKAYSLEEVMAWAKKCARSEHEVFYIQPKYDGLSGKLEGGILSSRGDGHVGQNYTSKLPLIKFDSAKSIDTKTTSLLGEIVISNDDFSTVFASSVRRKDGSSYKNQRNAVAGIIGCDDPNFYLKQTGSAPILTFVDYERKSWRIELKDLEAHWEAIKTGIRTKCEYPIDGIVIKLADQDYADSLGFTEHHPKGAIAFKFTNVTAWTKLIGVEWSSGKEQISAVGEVEPIEINGVTIRRVRLQITAPKNAEVGTWLENGSLQIGDSVLIERAGDIIPHVVESSPGQTRTPAMISVCPSCGSPTKVIDSALVCTNPDCSAKAVQKLCYTMSALGMKGVAESYAKKLYEILGVKSLRDLLKVTRQDLKSSQEFGDKMVDIFLDEIEQAKHSTFVQFLDALNVPSLGTSVAKLLVKKFDPSRIISGTITKQELIEIHGIGDTIAEEVSVGLRESSEMIQEAYALGSWTAPAETSSSKTICFTGKMSKPRKELEALAREAGYEPVGSVTSTLTVLVCADPNSGSSKMKRAREAGTKTISEEEFFAML